MLAEFSLFLARERLVSLVNLCVLYDFLYKRIKELRENKKESQQKLAMLLNVSQTMISRYELEQAYPDVEMLIKLAQHFGVSVDYLIGVSESKLPYTKSNLSEQEQQMLFLFKRLSKTQKEKAVSYIEGMLEE